LTAGALINAVARRLSGVGLLLREALAKGYSRSLELEADREAVRLVRGAGFDPGAARSALGRLAGVAPDNSGLAEYFSTHPALDERIRALEV
jgi:predicted Zn-dependent protease